MAIRSVIITPDSPLNREVERLIQEQFPENEQSTMDDLAYWLSLGISDYRGYLDGDQFVGFTFIICTEKMVFGLYLATDGKLHSKGYGSQIMNIVREIVKDRVFCFNIEALEASAENEEQRVRRLRFYERLNLRPTGYAVKYEVPFWVMSNRPEDFSPEELAKIQQLLFGDMAPEIVRIQQDPAE